MAEEQQIQVKTIVNGATKTIADTWDIAHQRGGILDEMHEGEMDIYNEDKVLMINLSLVDKMRMIIRKRPT